MFNSTSRYLVYCTINRGIKRVTIIPLSALLQRGPRERRRHDRDRCRFPLLRIVPLRRNEPGRVFPLNFEH